MVRRAGAQIGRPRDGDRHDRRRGARPDPAAGRRRGQALGARRPDARPSAARAICCREPRNALAEALRRHANGGMDVSDGLAGDLAKLCRAARLDAAVDVAHVPLSRAARTALAAEPALIETILTGGDDYEVLAAVPRTQRGPLCARPQSRGRRRSPRSAASRPEPGAARFVGPRRQGAQIRPAVVQPFLIDVGQGIHDGRRHQGDGAGRDRAGHAARRPGSSAKPGCSAVSPPSRICAAHAPRHAPALRVRIHGRRRRRGHRHQAQLGGARRGRAGAALRHHHRAAAGRDRIVRPALCGADRRRADGRTLDRVAGRRRVSRRRRPEGARALRARHGRRHHDRGGGEDRARRALVPALSSGAQRSRGRLRPGAARGCGRRSRAGAHPRRAGAHHARRARWRPASPRRSVPILRMLWDIATSPGWLWSMLRNGIPRFANLRAYVGRNAGIAAVAQFARRK